MQLVANRETSLDNHSGVLKVTHEGDIFLLSNTNSIVWSSITSRTTESPEVQLLDSVLFSKQIVLFGHPLHHELQKVQRFSSWIQEILL